MNTKVIVINPHTLKLTQNSSVCVLHKLNVLTTNKKNITAFRVDVRDGSIKKAFLNKTIEAQNKRLFQKIKLEQIKYL